jgi:GGDEF domain-containing protein
LNLRASRGEAAQMRRGRSLLSIVLGVVGLALGIVGLAADLPVLGLLAGVCALAAGALAGSSPTVAASAAGATPSVASASLTEPSLVPAGAPLIDDGFPEKPAPGATDEAGRPLVDADTGLYTEEYFKVAVETRVLAARRHLRPVAVVLFDVVEEEPVTGSPRAADPMPVADAIRETLREADTACRLSDGRFAFVLEDTPEDGAIWTVERLRRTLSTMGGAQTRWAGIACYPAHAFSADEVLDKAEAAFRSAREWSQDRIEVAVSD